MMNGKVNNTEEGKDDAKPSAASQEEEILVANNRSRVASTATATSLPPSNTNTNPTSAVPLPLLERAVNHDNTLHLLQQGVSPQEAAILAARLAAQQAQAQQHPTSLSSLHPLHPHPLLGQQYTELDLALLPRGHAAAAGLAHQSPLLSRPTLVGHLQQLEAVQAHNQSLLAAAQHRLGVAAPLPSQANEVAGSYSSYLQPPSIILPSSSSLTNVNLSAGAHPASSVQTAAVSEGQLNQLETIWQLEQANKVKDQIIASLQQQLHQQQQAGSTTNQASQPNDGQVGASNNEEEDQDDSTPEPKSVLNPGFNATKEERWMMRYEELKIFRKVSQVLGVDQYPLIFS